MFDDCDGDYLDPIDRDPSDYDDMSNDWWQDDDMSPEPGDTESDLEDDESDSEIWNERWGLAEDDVPDSVWEERWGLAEAEDFMQAGLPIW